MDLPPGAPARVSAPQGSRTRLIYRNYRKARTDPVPGVPLQALNAPKSFPDPSLVTYPTLPASTAAQRENTEGTHPPR